MKRITVFRLCLTAVFALSAMITASGTQAAEYGRCVANANGEYTSTSCTKKSAQAENGSYEWEGISPAGFTIAIGKATFSNEDGTATCKEGSETGKFTGPKTGEATVSFYHCTAEYESEHLPCTSHNAEYSEEIETFAFETTLIEHGEKGLHGLEPEAGEVWVQAANQHGAEAPWTDKFFCTGLGYYEADGSISGPFGPVNVMSATHSYHFEGDLGEQDLKTSFCSNESFTSCYYEQLPTFDTFEGTTTSGEDWEIRTAQLSPTVKAAPASEVTSSSATLRATVNPNDGAISECKFEYGTTSSYGSSVACSPSPESGESPVAVSASLTGLAAETTYHFRVVAKNPAGTSYVADQTFSTFLSGDSGTTAEPSEPATATDGELSATASGGTGTVTVGQYGSNPGGARLLGSAGDYLDVYQSTESSFSKIEFEDCALNGASILDWFNPQADSGKGEWEEVSRQSYIPGTPACIKVEIEASGTSPTLAQMTGTRFGDAIQIAAPEFGRCTTGPSRREGTKTIYEGLFTAKTCLVRSEAASTGLPTGKYELELEVFNKSPFATELTSGSVKLESAVKASTMTCTGESSEGEYTGQKTLAGVVLKLTGCVRGAEKCTSADKSAGEVVSGALEGVLGWEAKAAKKVALELYPRAGAFMAFSCGATSVSVRGSVIVPVKANKMSMTQALKFKASKGKQTPESLEGGAKDILEESSNGGASYERTGLSAAITQTNQAEVEINSAF
jgi:hypothetical protein